MITAQTVRKLALIVDEAEELPYFGKTSFRVKKNTFATLSEKHQRATLKLSESDQSIFSLYGDKTTVFPVPNKWEKDGPNFGLIKLIKNFLMMLSRLLIVKLLPDIYQKNTIFYDYRLTTGHCSFSSRQRPTVLNPSPEKGKGLQIAVFGSLSSE
ncbi:MAG: hypothetical protein U5M51_13455 [Emticicia sp.]|nr:hypothetical protein [Emticicia sp.]